MGKIIWKPGALEAPIPPALVTCGTLEKPNVLTVAWTGIVCTHPAMTYVSIRPQRYSYGLIKETGEFVINLTTAPLVWAADLCGVRSGSEVDKFRLASLRKLWRSISTRPVWTAAESCAWTAVRWSASHTGITMNWGGSWAASGFLSGRIAPGGRGGGGNESGRTVRSQKQLWL